MFKECLKVVVLGDSGVGKTSLRNRYLHDKFAANYRVTIGSDFTTKDVLLTDGGKVTLQIWDTAGQERFRSLSVSFFRGADACVLVYDVTNLQSLHNLRDWLKLFLQYADISDTADYPFIVIGNKTDLEDQVEIITEEMALEMCKVLRSECLSLDVENNAPAILANKLRKRESRGTFRSFKDYLGKRTSGFLYDWNSVQIKEEAFKSVTVAASIRSSFGGNNVPAAAYFTADDMSSIKFDEDDDDERQDDITLDTDHSLIHDVRDAQHTLFAAHLKDIPLFQVSAKQDSLEVGIDDVSVSVSNAFDYIAQNVRIPKFHFEISSEDVVHFNISKQRHSSFSRKSNCC